MKKSKSLMYQVFICLLIVSLLLPNVPAVAQELPEVQAITEQAQTSLNVDEYKADDNALNIKNKTLPPEMTSVSQASYADEEPAEIKRLRALTLQKKSEMQQPMKGQGLKAAASADARDLTREEVEELVDNGAVLEDLYWINYLVQSDIGYTGLELLSQKQSGATWDEIEESLGLVRSTDLSTVDESVYSSLNNQSRSVVIDDVYTVDNLKATSSLTSKAAMTSFDITVNSVINSGNVDFINQSGAKQYSDHSGNSEVISPSTGSLIWQQQLIQLPGRDGLDLNLGIMNQSNQTYAYTRISTGYQQSGIKKYNEKEAKNNIGIGWSFQFPSIETDADGIRYYHDGHGAAYQMDNYGFEIQGYQYGRVHSVGDYYGNAFVDGGEKSVFYLEFADLRREYYTENNPRLLGIVDRYGNKITFNYTDRITYDGESHKVLSSITDTLNRKIVFEYESTLNTSGTFYGENVVIKALDSNSSVIKKVTLTKSRMQLLNNNTPDGYAPTLWKITNHDLNTISNDQTTYFEYGNYQLQFNLYGKYFNGAWTSYHPIKRITYPNSSTEFDYEVSQHNIRIDGLSQGVRVNLRDDVIAGKTKNKIKYNYTDYEYTGLWSVAHSYDDYRYGSTSTVVSDTSTNGLSVTSVFTLHGRLESTTTKAANGEQIIEKNTEFDYRLDTRPTKTSTYKLLNGESLESAEPLIVQRGYDSNNNLSWETLPMTVQQSANNKVYWNKKEFAYDGNFLNSSEWYQNETDTAPTKEFYTYDPDSKRLLTYTDPTGKQTTFSYSYVPDPYKSKYIVTDVIAETKENNKIINRTQTFYGATYNYAYPTETWQWFNYGQSNEQKVVTKMSYYPDGQLKDTTAPNQKITTYEYDGLGRPAKITYPTTTDSNGYKYSETDNFSYLYVSTSYMDAVNTGTTTLEVSTTKKVTQLTAAGAVVRSVDTKAKSYYNGLGLLLLEQQFDEKLNSWVSTQYHYDDQGRAVYARDAQGNEVTAEYDVWGRLGKQTDALLNTYIVNYNLKARTTESYMNPSGSTEKYNYALQTADQWGRVISTMTYKNLASMTMPISEKYTYDLIGNITSYTDPEKHANDEGVTTTYRYDALKRLITVKDALSQTTSYTYDGNGQITKATIQAPGGQPQVLNEKSYNELGLLTQKKDASGAPENITYNNLGLVQNRTDRAGTSYSYEYNERQQLTTEKLAGVINNVAQTQETKYTRSTTDILTQKVNVAINGVATTSQAVTSDTLGRVRSVESTVGSSFNAKVNGTPDDLGRLTRLTDVNSGISTNYVYTKTRLTSIQTNGNAATSSAAGDNAKYEYYPNGMVQKITYPTLSSGQSLTTEYTYNKALGWVESVINKNGSTVLSSYVYSYDNNGNVKIVDAKVGTSALQTTTYSYDGLNRLIFTGRSTGGTDTYTYDVKGNRLTQTKSSGTDAQVQDTSYSYDLKNVLMAMTVGAVTSNFTYYADGLRFSKTTSGVQTKYVYDYSGQVISSEKSNGEKASYIRGDRLLVKKDRTNSAAVKDYYYLYNGHGDVVQIVDKSGTIVNSYVYDEWGNITSKTEGIQNSFKYAGEIYDEETGLYYLRARYYDPSIGRFLNEDTYEGQIDNPLSQNLYTYVHNNPLIYNDPTGHFAGTIAGAILGGIVGGITAAIQKTNIKAGIAGGAVTGAIGGAALDLTLATGGAAFVISVSVAAGAFGGAAGDVVNQAGNNLAKGKSATSDLNVQSILINAGIGAASGALGGATAVVMRSFEDATKKIFQGIALNALESGNDTVLDTSISNVYKAAVKMGNTNSTIDYTATVVYSASSNTLVYLVNNQVVQTVVVNVNQVPTQKAKQSFTKADGTVIRVQKD